MMVHISRNLATCLQWLKTGRLIGLPCSSTSRASILLHVLVTTMIMKTMTITMTTLLLSIAEIYAC